MEEAGIKADIIAYIGSRSPEDMWFGEIDKPTKVQKTVLYFLAELKDLDLSKRDKKDPESTSEIKSFTIKELKDGFLHQYKKYGMEEFNEVEILDRVERFLSNEDNLKLNKSL